MKNLANRGQELWDRCTRAWQPLASRLAPMWTFIQRHSLPFFFILSILATTIFYYDVVFLGKTLLSPGGITAGVMGDAGAYGDPNPLPTDFSKYAVFMKDLGSNAWAGEPQVFKVAQAWRHWDLPLWNDNAGVGKPLAANFLSTAFYPLKLILYLLPNVKGWDIYLLARFIFGIFFTFLFLRELKVKLLPAFLAGVAFAFSGYFVMLQDIQNMDVDLILPALFWVAAYAMNLARQQQIKWYQYLLAVGVFTAIFLTNIPESLLMVLAAGGIYWAYRILALYKKDKPGCIRALRLALQITIPVVLIVLPLYLMNAEFIQHGVSTHGSEQNVGAGIYIQPRFFVLTILPYLQSSPLLLPILPANGNALNYFGIAGFFLVCIGALDAWRQKGTRAFVLILGLVTVAKIYGFPIINDVIGHTPGFDRVLYMKYAQPLVSFCAASLMAFGLESLLKKTFKRSHLYLVLISGVLIVWFGIQAIPEIQLTATNQVVLILYTLIVAVLGLVLTMPIDLKYRVMWVGALGTLMLSEIWLLVPRDGRPQRYETFTKPPFVSFLQEQKGPFRIYAYDGLLYPEISTGFNLDDIRDLDGLIVNNYFSYIQQFISPTIYDRFTGKATASSESVPPRIVANPFADILNVQYLVSQNPVLDLLPLNPLNTLILSTNPPTPTLRETAFNINGDIRKVLFEHTPTTACAVLPVTADAPVLRFAIAIDQSTWGDPMADGAQFFIHDEAGQQVFAKTLNPSHFTADRGWFEQQVDLSAYVNTTTPLCLQTEPHGNTESDWAGWADLRLTPKDTNTTTGANAQYQLVYHSADGYVYKNTHSLDRGFTVGKVSSFSNEDDVLDYMKLPGFDPHTEAVVLTKPGQAAIPNIDSEHCSNGVFDNYSRPKASQVAFGMTSDSTCFLVWSETDYPGWEAYVDGKATTLYTTDVMLRGLVLEQGQHHITMKYKPKTFYYGLWATLFGLLLSGFWVYRFSRKQPA